MKAIDKVKPLVSVIIPAYNAEKTICETLDSVFSQSYKALQVVVIDDASTDDTLKIVQSYEDPRLEILALSTNVQVVAARNAGMELVKGEYIAFLDSDDIWMHDKIEKQVTFLERERAYGACFTWAQIIDERGCPYAPEDPDDPDIVWHYNVFHEGNRSYRDWFLRFLSGGNFLSLSSALIRADVVHCIGGQNLSLLQLQDFEYWIRVLSHSEIYILCEELAAYRRARNGTSLSSRSPNSRNRTINEDVYVCAHFFEHLSNERFALLFRDLFYDPNSSTAEEIMCEKAFLLKRAYCGPEAFLTSIQSLLSNDKTAAVLAEKFGYTPKDFYQANAKPRQFEQSVLNQFQDNENNLRNELNKQLEEGRDLRMTISEYKERENELSFLLKEWKSENQKILEDEYTLKLSLAERESECRQLRMNADNLKRSLTERESECQQLRMNEDNLKRSLAERESEYQLLQMNEGNLKRSLAEQAEKCTSLEYELACREAECQQLRDKENRFLNELAAIKATRSWRLGQRIAKFSRFFVPAGSKRAVLARLFVTMVKHPGKFFSCLTPKKLKKFFRLLRRSNTEQIQALVQMNITGQPVPSALEVVAPEIVPVKNEVVQEKTVADYTVLAIPQWENPTVSIVIPVYNQFEYTYRCVESILKNSGDITYEILIGNDCSTDLTTQIDSILPGVKCITNEKNLRFVRNCNNAAKYARGKYLLFLNNDTQVQENWLEPLVTLIESADDIGMVGSKLIYPDGLLQEAGGILWRDGSAWNFGNRQNPSNPEFNYVKEVDYISGASIMLPRALWEEIGGFDELFAPAYCDDSDLAFTVRKKGYRVMYQPKSVVVHFEGVSNGTDTASGQKQYQIVNSQKFYEKWKDVLASHPENGDNVFQARDRSYGKKTLLMVDHYVPQYDKDAGSRTVYQYLKLFVSLGFHVKFIGDNFFQHEPYTSVLQQMGIEVLYGPDYAANWKTWLQDNGKHIDYVFLNRPHIAPKYMDAVRQYTNAKVVYYGHDLGFLREMREYEVTGDISFKESSMEWQPKELDLMRKADYAYYPSYVEVDAIHAIDPQIRVKAIPAYLFDDLRWEGYDFEARKDIMFIGGFRHRPNVDAVKWLAKDILPELVKRLPDIKIHILGSNAPQDVLALANDHLIIEGFVTDEVLEYFYRNCRISFVPLRYGAGIKGKVVEAMRFGTPVVTTSTGAEGIPNAEEVMLIEDDAAMLAEKIAALYQNADALTTMSKNSISYVQENYSIKNAIQVISSEFDLQGKEINS